MRASSAPSSRVEPERRLQELDEKHFAEIEVAMLYIEEARERAERAAKALRADGADAHLIEALDRSATELSDIESTATPGHLLRRPEGAAEPLAAPWCSKARRSAAVFASSQPHGAATRAPNAARRRRS